MHILDLWQMALRGLFRRPTRTTLTALGITVAVASMVIFLSLGEGLRQVFTTELGNLGPDIQVSLNGTNNGFSITQDLPETTVGEIEALKEELGIEYTIPLIASVRGGFDPGQSFIIYGIPPATGIEAMFQGTIVRQGRTLNAGDEHQLVAVVGAKAAENASLKLGSTLHLNRRTDLQVVGILEPHGGLSDSIIFVPITTLQKSLNATGLISSVMVKLKDPSKAKATAKILSERLNLEAQTQADFLNFLDRALKISDAVRFGISLIALIVGGLAVANTVMMGVFERTREFGTLRAIGAKPGFVRILVLTESLLLSLVGGAGGIILGFIGIKGVNFYTQKLANINAAALTPRLFLLAVSISLLLGLLAGLLPARSAGRLRITEALGRI